ncbi:MAG: extracellular solute-binding protein [Bacteroidota bacterium]|jgi:arabinogalactan oligomer/maltooligosaccharide transport system permease protein
MIRRYIWLLLLPAFVVNVQAQTELHLWTQMRPESRRVLAERIAVFQKLHPDIRIRELFKETEELRASFQAAAAFTGGGPDLVYGPSDYVGAFESMRIIRSLDDLFPPDYLAGFDPKALTRYNGKLYQLGDEIGNHLALGWNRKLFTAAGLDHAPRTFAELIAFGKKLTIDKNRDGVIDQYGLVWNYTEPFFFMPFYTSWGGRVLDDKNRPTLDNNAAIQAFSFMKRLRNEERIIPRETDYEIAETMFLESRAAMIINGPWAWGRYVDQLGSAFALDLLPLNEETGLHAAPFVTTKGYFLNRSVEGKKLEAVRTFLRFILSPESQVIFSERLKTIPSQIAAQNDPRVLADPFIRISVEQVRIGVPSPLIPEMRAVWDAMRPPYQSVLGGNLTPAAAAREQQRLAVQKIREMNEGGEDSSSATIAPFVFNAAAILLALLALFLIIRNGVLPLMRNPSGGSSRDARFALLLILPAAVLMFGVVIYPFLYNIVISFSDMSMRTVNDWRIVGFDQYGKVFGIDRLTAALDAGGGFSSALVAMFSTEFYGVFLKTIIWTVVNVTLHVVIGVFLAVLLNRHLPGKAIFRVLLILPWAVPQYITALTWRGMFNTDSGAVNAILGAVFSIDPIPWLTEETLAFAAAIITNIWLGFPFMMIIALGALQSIPKELYEAADIDGATAWKKFRHVTVPLLKPVMIPAITLGVVWTFNNINIIWLVTNGGQPADTSHILVSYVYRAAFNLYRYGYAAAFSMIIFLLLAGWSIVFMRKTSVTETVY